MAGFFLSYSMSCWNPTLIRGATFHLLNITCCLSPVTYHRFIRYSFQKDSLPKSLVTKTTCSQNHLLLLSSNFSSNERVNFAQVIFPTISKRMWQRVTGWFKQVNFPTSNDLYFQQVMNEQQLTDNE